VFAGKPLPTFYQACLAKVVINAGDFSLQNVIKGFAHNRQQVVGFIPDQASLNLKRRHLYC
jgi:hypothetical protein